MVIHTEGRSADPRETCRAAYHGGMPDGPLVLQTEPLDDEATTWLRDRCRLVACRTDDPGFQALLAEAEGLVVRTYTIVDAELLAAAPRLRVVGRAGVGLDNIDVEECRQRGIAVVSTPDANTQAVVEYVLALLCDALRPRAALDHAVSEEEWRRLRTEIVGQRQLDECTLGILGLGRIGRRLAEVARAIGMRVLFNDLLPIDPSARHGAVPVPVEALFERSDVLSVHVDGRASNRHFVGEALLRRLRPNAVLINTTRGFVIDPHALAAFLKDHSSALALLDVHEREPFTDRDPLLPLPNAHLFPHLASRTATATKNMSWVVREVWEVLKNGQASRH